MKKLFLYKSFKKGKRFPKRFEKVLQKSGVPKKFSAHNFCVLGKNRKSFF